MCTVSAAVNALKRAVLRSKSAISVPLPGPSSTKHTAAGFPICSHAHMAGKEGTHVTSRDASPARQFIAKTTRVRIKVVKHKKRSERGAVAVAGLLAVTVKASVNALE